LQNDKAAINDLVRERFDVVEAKRNGAEDPVPSVEAVDGEPINVSAPQTNGVHKSSEASAASPSASTTPAKREATSDDLSDVDDSAPPKKKRKTNAEDDAALAARLQAEEDKMARATRGVGSRKTAPVKKKKTPKKKARSRVTGSDDSDVEDSPRAVNRNTGFHACHPSIICFTMLMLSRNH
jgi:upstream activation factor subunit UAF30